MHILRSWEEARQPGLQNGAITIGNFDGVHMGHQQVLAELKGHAEAVQGPAIVVTFEPHPRSILYPEETPRRLCHVEERLHYIEATGVDAVLLLEFDRALANWSAQQFAQTLHQAFIFKHIHVGYDFAFGHDREGHVDDLRSQGNTHAFTVSEAAAFEMLDAVVSSSRIRSLIEAGDFSTATQLLNRDYSMAGEVLHGEQRGRKMNFPTANIDVGDMVHPPIGIYAVRARTNEKQWHGAAYLGYRPTFHGRTLLLETHMLDDSPDLYGQHLDISFVQWLREDRTFAHTDDLARQISEDCDQARKVLGD